MDSEGITARGVEMRFGQRGGGEPVLQNLDVDVAPGSFVTLLGPSGCGKSTLLKILGGILEPVSGDVRIADRPAPQSVRDKEIGLVLQQPALLPWKNARENAALLADLAGGSRRDARSAADEALELVGLTAAANKLPHELSGGMAQRVSIARALAMDPKILLMDEPFGALDAITRDEMNMKLAEIWTATRKTVVFVTHSIPEAVFLSDVVHVMQAHPGRVVDTLEVDLPRPRTRDLFDDSRFGEYARHLRDRLEPEPQRSV